MNLWSLQLAISWENTVEEIKRLPGFEVFLKAKTFSQVAGPAADEGPVVILDVEDSRSDALILIGDRMTRKRSSSRSSASLTLFS